MPDLILPSSPTSYWVGTSPGRHHSKLDRDLEVDVAIIGGGITGITAAVLLQRGGKRVAVLEAKRIAEGVTGNTTAHLTEAIDARYATLIRDFGVEGASLAAQASREAIERMAAFIEERQIACGWRWLPGYLYSEREADRGALRAEYEAAKRVGVRVAMTEEVPLPFPARAAVRFENQAEFHVRNYLHPLCDEIAQGGGLLFENTRVLEIEEGRPAASGRLTGPFARHT